MPVKFKVGDKVMISKESSYYQDGLDGDEHNPINCYGRVNSINKDVIYVNWDNGMINSYSAKDLKYPAGMPAETAEELTVDKEFVMQAYESACSTWKKKIEQKFPELFPNPYAKIVKDESSIGTSTLFYLDSKDTYKALEYNIALIDGIAGQGRDVPNEARYRGIYVNNRSKELKLELVETEDGYAIVFKRRQSK